MRMKEDLRYSRITMLEGIGETGLEKLKSGKILVVGCGALGSLCAMYLAATGVGHIGIADFDTIDISNLQRQLFFEENQLGELKSEVLANRIKALNSNIEISVYPEMIRAKKAKEIFPGYDFIIDGSDNPSTKNLTATVCEAMKIAYCIGGVKEYSGQIMSWSEGHRGYSELFGDVPQCSGYTPCSLAGVLGPAAGVAASVQAAEAIKFLSGAGEMLYDRIFTFDLYNNQTRIFSF